MADHRPLKYNHPVYRFFPHKTKGEGFFLAALRKADGEAEEIRFKNKNKKEKGKTAPAIPKAVKSFLSDTSSFSPEWSGSILRMLPNPSGGPIPCFVSTCAFFRPASVSARRKEKISSLPRSSHSARLCVRMLFPWLI